MSIYQAMDAFLQGARPLSEMHAASMEFWADISDTAANFFSHNPLLSYAFEQVARNNRAMARSWVDIFREYPDPGFNLTETIIDGQKIEVEQTTVMDRPFCSLENWRRKTNRYDPKLLIIAPYSGHYASLLRDTVNELLPHHNIYVTNWKNARDVSLEDAPKFDQDDQIFQIKEFLERLGPDTHVMAVCQPTFSLVAALCLMAEEGKPMPASVTLMAGPVDAGAAHSEVAEFPKNPMFHPFMSLATSTVPDRFAGAGREVHMSSAQLTGFMAPNMDKHLEKQLEIHVKMMLGETEEAEQVIKFYKDYFAVLDMPAEFIKQTIERVFVNRELAMGTLVIDGRPINPLYIKNLPILTVEGSIDPISPPGHTKAAHDILGNVPERLKFHHEEPGAKHYSVFSGSKWRNSISQRVSGFIRQFGDKGHSPLPSEKAAALPMPRKWAASTAPDRHYKAA